MAYRGLKIRPSISPIEWEGLLNIAGGDESRLRNWLSSRIIDLASKVAIEKNSPSCSLCDMARGPTFQIPHEFISQINILSIRYGCSPDAIIRNYILYPELAKYYSTVGF